jgi:hypothetical protein
MKRLIILLFVIQAGLQSARAQLGEPAEKCSALFGKPLYTKNADTAGTKIANYRTSAFQITACFKKDVAEYFIYRKSDGSSMSDAEIEGILSTQTAEKRKWFKRIITGERRPAVGTPRRSKSPFHDLQTGPRQWYVLGHDEFGAAYYLEKHVLLIWNSKTGFDAASVLKENRL